MTATPAAKAPKRPFPLGSRLWQRRLRLWSGAILLTFVTLHLLNHALGVFGVEAMEQVQAWRVWIWRSPPGTLLLAGAFVLHFVLGLKRILGRRTWRMPLAEALQIILGLLIPVFLLEHVVGTAYVARFTGVDDSYSATLRHLWPAKAVAQTALILIVWTHGMLGLHYALRAKPWYPRWREIGLTVAVLIPLLALAGFAAGGREAIEIADPAAEWSAEQRAAFTQVLDIGNRILLLLAAFIFAVIAIRVLLRRFGNKVVIRYLGHGDVNLSRGATLLEASRAAGIPHPSICGGRGRCSTCRVLVHAGIEELPDPGMVERKALTRISAPPRVRLACQIKPTRPLTVQILLPVDVERGQIDWEEEAFKWGVEREATVLFVDLRAFTTLSRTQPPYDLVLLLNKFVAEMRQAIEAHGGRVGMFLSDGLMGIFGLSGQRAAGSRGAIAAAQDMLKATQALNTEFAAALSLPLRIGIGIHTGHVVMARVGSEERGYTVTALGETVSVASRLESATKELLADCLVSQETLDAAGRAAPGTLPREVHVRHRDRPVTAYALGDTSVLPAAAE
jgi:adenylate cyclase